jgi:hypothetical protein
LEQPLGRVENPAVRSPLSSLFPQFGQMKYGIPAPRLANPKS